MAEEFGSLVIPFEVAIELDKIKKKAKGKDKERAELALKVIEANRGKIKFVKLGKKFVDEGIKNYAKNRKDVIVATLDRNLRKQLSNKILAIRAKKKIALI